MAPRGRRYGKRKMRKMAKRGKRYSKFKSGYSRPTLIKRVGQLIKIGNDTTTGSASALSSGNGSLVVGANSTDNGGTNQFPASLRFKLDSVMDYTDITQLFDRYKILGVKLKFMYQHNNASNNNTGNNVALPMLSYAFDGDDANNVASYTDLAVKQYTKTKVLNANSLFQAYFKPRITKEVYRTSTTTGYTSEKACYIDCNTADVHHFGLKMWIQNWCPGTTILNLLTIQPIYYLALKDTQ